MLLKEEFAVLRTLEKELRHEGELFSDETFSIEEKDRIISLIKDNEYDYVLGTLAQITLFVRFLKKIITEIVTLNFSIK